MSRVRVKISAEGEVHLEVSGALGTQCDALTEALEREVGTTLRKERKAEYYEQADVGHEEATHSGLDH